MSISVSASESSVLPLGDVVHSHSGTSALTFCAGCSNHISVFLSGAVEEDEVAKDIKCVACMRGASEAVASPAATESAVVRDSVLVDAQDAMGIGLVDPTSSHVVMFSTASQPTVVVQSEVLVQQNEQQAVVVAVVAAQPQQADNAAVGPAAVQGVVKGDGIAVASAILANIVAVVVLGGVEVDDAKYDEQLQEALMDEARVSGVWASSPLVLTASSRQVAMDARLLSPESADKVAAEHAKIQAAEEAAVMRAKEHKDINIGLQEVAVQIANAEAHLKSVQAETAVQLAKHKVELADFEAAWDAKRKELVKEQEARTETLAAKQKAKRNAVAALRGKKDALMKGHYALTKVEHELQLGVAAKANTGASVAPASLLRSFSAIVQGGGGVASLSSSSSTSSSSSSVSAASPASAKASSTSAAQSGETSWSCNGWPCEKDALIAKLSGELAKAESAHGANCSRARMFQTLLRRAKRVNAQVQLTFVVRAATERNFCRFGTCEACPFGKRCSFRHEPQPLPASRTGSSSGAGASSNVARSSNNTSSNTSSSSSSSSSNNTSSSNTSSSSKASRPSKTSLRRAKERAKNSALEQLVAELSKKIDALTQQTPPPPLQQQQQ